MLNIKETVFIDKYIVDWRINNVSVSPYKHAHTHTNMHTRTRTYKNTHHVVGDVIYFPKLPSEFGGVDCFFSRVKNFSAPLRVFRCMGHLARIELTTRQINWLSLHCPTARYSIRNVDFRKELNYWKIKSKKEKEVFNRIQKKIGQFAIWCWLKPICLILWPCGIEKLTIRSV